jgi:hypothetical protein
MEVIVGDVGVGGFVQPLAGGAGISRAWLQCFVVVPAVAAAAGYAAGPVPGTPS